MSNSLHIQLKRISVYSKDKLIYSIYPYHLKYEDFELIGNQAYNSRYLYPQYTISLAKTVMEDNLTAFEYLFRGLIYEIEKLIGRAMINQVVVLDYLPLRYIEMIEKVMGVRTERKFPNNIEQDFNSLLYSGISLADGRQLISDQNIIKTQLLQVASSLLNGEAVENKEDYDERLEYLQEAIKCSLGECIGQFNPQMIRWSDPHGKVNEKEFVLLRTEKAANKKEVLKKLLLQLAKEKKKLLLVSPFSFGKSTLVNALTGCNIFSVDYLADTAFLTECVYAPCYGVHLEFTNGDKEFMVCKSMAEIQEKLSSYNWRVQKVNKPLKHVTVYAPDFDMKHINIIDTPGLFSTQEEHDEITKQALLSKNIMIAFVFMPTQIENRAFINFIQDHQKNSSVASIYIISQRDTYLDQDEKMVNLLEKILSSGGIHSPQIISVSGLYGHVARCYQKQMIDLDQLRKSGVYIIDDDGFPVGGKSLQMEHIPEILKVSRIKELEDVLFGQCSKINSGGN